MSCPAGFNCGSGLCLANLGSGIDFNVSSCSSGWECPPSGTRRCPSGSFCVNGQRMVCGDGLFCPLGSFRPYTCPATAICPRGSSRYFLISAPIVIAIVVLLAVLLVLSSRQKKSKKSLPDPLPAVPAVPALPDILPLPVLVAKPPKKQAGIPIRYESLCFKVGERTVINGIDGQLNAGKLTAIMGPSGCGKTTLVSMLMGKVRPTSGAVLSEGSPVRFDEDSVRRAIGFVSQDDVLTPTLTVEETLMRSAELRLPVGEDRRALVESILGILKLKHVRGSIVGDNRRRGVSGGERRRVSIGVELCAKPRLLVLDESTTGLDSSGASLCMQVLSELAHDTGITVCAIIHQPRLEILQMIDMLILLVPGGKCVFFGHTSEMLEVLEETSGRTCPASLNPADFAIDLLSEPTARRALVSGWRVRTAMRRGVDALGGERTAITTATAEEVRRPFPGPLRQLAIFAKYSLIQGIWRESGTLATDLLLHVATACFVAVAFVGIPLYLAPVPDAYLPFCPDAVIEYCTVPTADNYPLLSVYIVMALGFVGATISLRTFETDLDVYYRFASWGLSTPAYFFGRLAAQVPTIIVGALLFTLTFAFIVSPPLDLGWFLLLNILLEAAVFGVGHATTMIIPRETVALAAVSFCMLDGLGTGAATNVHDMSVMGVISWGRWYGEALYALGFGLKHAARDASALAQRMSGLRYAGVVFKGYNLNEDEVLGRNAGILVAFIVLLHLLALTIMALRWKAQKK